MVGPGVTPVARQSINHMQHLLSKSPDVECQGTTGEQISARGFSGLMNCLHLISRSDLPGLRLSVQQERTAAFVDLVKFKRSSIETRHKLWILKAKNKNNNNNNKKSASQRISARHQ